MHFKHIIAEFGHEEIYTLSLYYNAGDWSYILPTFATERGLEEIHKAYGSDYSKSDLRWSPCDSPHHEAHGLYFDQVDEILTDLRSFTEKASSFIDDNNLPKQNNLKAYIAIVIDIHQKIHNTVLETLQKLAQIPEVVEYLKNHQCLIVLEAGDMDPEVLDQDLVTLNGESVHERIKSWDS